MTQRWVEAVTATDKSTNSESFILSFIPLWRQFLANTWPFDKLLIPLKFPQKLR